MIAIVNQGLNYDDQEGEHYYHVYINRMLICEFKHCRRDGLVECLRKAADAVEDYFEDE